MAVPKKTELKTEPEPIFWNRNRTGTDLLEPEPNRNRSSGTVNNMTVVTKKIKRVEQDNIVVCDSDSEESEGNKENDEADFF